MITRFMDSDATLLKHLQTRGVYDKAKLDRDIHRKISRFTFSDVHNRSFNCKEYIFFIKPKLNILKNRQLQPQLANYPKFLEAQEIYMDCLFELQYNSNNDLNPFMNTLGNRVRNTMDLPTRQSVEKDTAKNAWGTSLGIRGHSFSSNEKHTFSLEFSDDERFQVYKIFDLWDTYNNLKRIGAVSADPQYAFNRKSHDKIGIYKFILAEDYETILFYAYAAGVDVLNVPTEAMSEFDASNHVYTVNFKADFVFDSDPILLEDFNALVSPYVKGKRDIKLYDYSKGHVNADFASCPYIYKDSSHNKLFDSQKYVYKLGWKG